MPSAQFKSVYAVSSEDAIHCASNLLKIQSGKKWKTKEVGEKKAYVILQLDGAQQITGIDIGNEHSAFIAVSVGKHSYANDEFKEILILSSFMTPTESKSSTNTNRVRCFARNALVEHVAQEKWDLVKVTCTQPFNRHTQYGLSFVKIHVSGNKESLDEGKQPGVLVAEKKPGTETDNSRIGLLQLREESPDSESESTNSLFKRWKQTRNEPMSAAAAIRAASSPASLKKQSESLKPSKVNIGGGSPAHSIRKNSDEQIVRNRNRDDLLFDKEDDVSNERLEKQISEDQKRFKKKNDEQETRKKKQGDPSVASSHSKLLHSSDERKLESPTAANKQNAKENLRRSPLNTSGHNRKVPVEEIVQSTLPGTSRKRLSSQDGQSGTPSKRSRQTKSIQYKPFNELLRGVVLVISGIQNPDRGVLRQKAIDLGARYKPDWDDSCTHLICAFKNTPKYNQVKGKGKIITRRWIEKCYDQKKYLPWRRYALDDREAEQRESDDEILDISLRPTDVDNEYPTSANDGIQQESATNVPTNSNQQRQGSSDDVLVHYDAVDSQNYLISSGSDTDEDIEKLARNNNLPGGPKHPSDKTAASKLDRLSPPRDEKKTKIKVFDASTDEDESIKVPNVGGSSPNLFDGIKFYLDGSLPAIDLVKIKQYIEKFRGKFIENLADADYLISKNVVEKAETGFKGEVVSPLWVYECYDMGCVIPTRRYLL